MDAAEHSPAVVSLKLSTSLANPKDESANGIGIKSSDYNNSEEWEEWMMWDDANGCPSFPPRGSHNSTMADGEGLSRKRKSRHKDPTDLQVSPAVEQERLAAPARSHTIIERRYRSNINAKIADLRDSIPRLRGMIHATASHLQNNDVSTQKLNKATILSTAVAYIQDLERDKQRLEAEVSRLKARLGAMKPKDDAVESTMEPQNISPTTPAPLQETVTYDCSTSSSWQNPVQGMIQIPEDIRKIRTASVQAQYAERPYIAYDQNEDESQSTFIIGQSGARRAQRIGKIVAGSFAGLMVVQGFSDRETAVDKHTKRSLQDNLLQPSRPWSWQNTYHFSSPPMNLQYIILGMKAFVILFVLGFGVFLYAFCYKPQRRKQDMAPSSSSPPSLASPLEVRKNAWLTAIQTVRVPRHEMFPEWVAVNLEALHYVVRRAIGWHGYSRVTGQRRDGEIARIRAWDIAIDAQLMGGDSDISGSRLILTILASGTLPMTPARLMLKALHLRILLWKASKHGESPLWSFIHKIAAFLATHQWRKAQDLQRALPHTELEVFHDNESLPEHHTALLQLSCSEVLTGQTIRRAYNLAWSRPTHEDVVETNSEMDLVVEDSTIRSPLDAICAWFSSSTLQKALFASLEAIEDYFPELEWNFGVALHTAPPASIAQARALAANAVFVKSNRQAAISMLSQDFPSATTPSSTDSMNDRSGQALFIDSRMPEAVGYDVTLATYCALALDNLEDPAVHSGITQEVLEVVGLGYQNVEDLTWLSFAAAYRLIQVLASREDAAHRYPSFVAPIGSRLIRWVKALENSQGHGKSEPFSGSTVQRAIDDIDIHMKKISKEIVPPHHVSSFPLESPAATEEPSTDGDVVSLFDKSTNRRLSRASQDSGYGSTA